MNLNKLVVEFNLRKRKWLISSSYNPHKDNIFKHMEIITYYIHISNIKNLELYSSQYERNFIVGDFNVRVSDSHMNDFCYACNLKLFFHQIIALQKL